MECTLHLECTWSGVGVYFYWWVIWPSPWSGILVYTSNIRSVVGVYTPVGVVTEWLWSVHSKLECTLRQGKGVGSIISPPHPSTATRLVFAWLYATFFFHVFVSFSKMSDFSNVSKFGFLLYFWAKSVSQMPQISYEYAPWWSKIKKFCRFFKNFGRC